MGETDLKVVFITGTSRSGSTVLGRVLGHARGLRALGELNLIWQRGVQANEVCSCRRPFRDCPFWLSIFQNAFGGFDRVDHRAMMEFVATSAGPRRALTLLAAQHGRPSASDAPCRAILSQLYHTIAEQTHSRVLVDTSKQPGYALLLAALGNLDVRVIHLVRDSRAVSFSWQRRKLRFQSDDRAVLMGRRSLARGALVWMRGNLLCEMLRFGPSKYLRLRYEDFASNPRKVIGRLGTFIGEELTDLPFVGDHTMELRDSHQPSGNPMRFDEGRLEIRVDDEWQRAMPPRARGLVTALSLPVLLRYGYDAGAGRLRATPPASDRGWHQHQYGLGRTSHSP